MDFGHLENVDHEDFTLPGDHPVTKKLIKELHALSPEKGSVHIGCAKWGRPDWVGKIYPKGTKPADFLDQYVKHFNTIELNAMFYRLFPKSTIQKWAALAKGDFLFCPKFTNSISHLHQLKNADRETDLYLDSMLSFGDKLGHCFLQLSDRFGVNRANVLHDYLKKLPRDFPVCVELRHEDWFRESDVVSETFSLFKELGIGTVITDTSGRRDCIHQKLTIPVAFIRFVGNNLHPTDFTRIDAWVDRLQSWMENGIKIYFFIHNHEESNSPELAKYTVQQINRKCNLNLKEPELFSKQATLR